MRVGSLKGFALVVMVMCGALVCNAQRKDDRLIHIQSYGGSNCGEVAAQVDTFLQSTKPVKSIFIVSYNGEKESRRGVNLQRLRIANKYITESLHRTGVPIVAAAAVNPSEGGKLEVYVDGSLALQIDFAKDAYLALSPCYSN